MTSPSMKKADLNIRLSLRQRPKPDQWEEWGGAIATNSGRDKQSRPMTHLEICPVPQVGLGGKSAKMERDRVLARLLVPGDMALMLF